MSAETTSNVVERMKGRGAGADRPRVVFRTDWKRATRRLIVGGLCAVTAASLTFPSAAMAAEWVNVGGTQYDAAAGDEAHTWSWDGANDMQLNGYNGGPIEAAGRLDLTYEGGNTVTNDSGEGISVVNGVNEKAELNITGGASDSLTVDATSDAIESQGDINISGDGTVNSTASRADGIDAEGNLTISGGGTVNATGSSDGIEVGGNATIDTSGNVVAKGGSNNGLDVNGNLTITGGGNVTASSENDEAVAVDGDLSISGGSRLEASSEMRTGLLVEGALSAVDSTLVASGTCEGLYVYKGVTFDHATVRVAARNPGNEAFGLFTDEDDIVIRNGSVVEAFAEGAYSAGIYTQNCEEGGAGGHMFVSESVVKAVARYLEGEGQDGGDIAMNYASSDVDGDEQLGRNAGIVVLTKNGMSPAKLSIVRSTVTAEGDTAAILVCATSEDGSVAGTIELEGSIIQTPAGGHVSDYNAKYKGRDRDSVEYDVGQTIGLSGETITSLDSADIAKSAVIVPEEVPVPAPSGSSTSDGANVTQATARKISAAGSAIPQTGDASLTGVLSAGFAGLAALVSGLFVSRKRG
ncbi:LPXTG cell wall anchor domain-containing protein [uncultured Parolsenella sp.]|uniref:LPXTG cell wall anchor domain-containing protein n=1 Tax=uncultured Parolsenella sp. TaxID=2083008 RepID=UPI0025E2AFE0|nr:LPXTG cell wall anchor domain-containing protein [uncultured Parolsenella sp.]